MNLESSTSALDAVKNLPDLASKCSNLEEAKNYCINFAKTDGADDYIGKYKDNLIIVAWSHRVDGYLAYVLLLEGLRQVI